MLLRSIIVHAENEAAGLRRAKHWRPLSKRIKSFTAECVCSKKGRR